MKKKITIIIECETEKEDWYIKEVMTNRMYRALDTSPHYIAEPKKVENITVTVEENLKEHVSVEMTDKDYEGIPKGTKGCIVACHEQYNMYSVEFFDENGITIDVRSVHKNHLKTI